MISKLNNLLMVTVLFAVSSIMIYFFSLKTVAARGATTLPYPLLSVLVIAVLFICTLFLLNSAVNQQQHIAKGLREDLERASRELESTKVSQEEKVERRTFEISVANAALNREIAERIQAETEMKKIKRQLELILESAGEGIFGLDAKGNVTFVNKAASLMLGWASQDLIGKSHHKMVHHTWANGEHYPVEECPISQAFQDGTVHFGSDEVFWAKDGESFPVDFVSTPILENGKLTGAVVVFRDISTFK